MKHEGNLSYYRVFCGTIETENIKNTKQGNRGDIKKFYITRQFFEASGPQDLHFFEKILVAWSWGESE